METGRVIQGRFITPEHIAEIRALMAENPAWNRTRLSRELCERWDWRNDVGRIKDMAARTLLLKLDRAGEIRLPPSRAAGNLNAFRNRRIAEVEHDRTPVECALGALRPLRIEPLAGGDRRMGLFKFLLHRYHYLGHRNCVGENLKYLISDRSGRVLGCMLFGSAAWKAGSRDEFIGWDRQARERNLRLMTNNTRFLILPWVRVPHLASHLLARICRVLPAHWMGKYGHPVHLLETFVERDRFRGTCYRAAGWRHVGTTTGRSRNDTHQTLSVPVKEVFVQPLCADFRRRLCVPACPRPAGRAGR